jgi:hypothetical protein
MYYSVFQSKPAQHVLCKEQSLLGILEIQGINQNRGPKKHPLLTGARSFRELDFVIIDLIVGITESFLGNFSHASAEKWKKKIESRRGFNNAPSTILLPSNNVHSLSLIGIPGVASIDIARNDAASVGTRMTISVAIHAHAAATGRRMNDIDLLIVVVVDFELRNEPPPTLPNVSEVIFSREDGRLLLATALAGAEAASKRTINF